MEDYYFHLGALGLERPQNLIFPTARSHPPHRLPEATDATAYRIVSAWPCHTKEYSIVLRFLAATGVREFASVMAMDLL
jgi:hypothetical protein